MYAGRPLIADQLGLEGQWLSEQRRFAIATLVEADGSAPFAPGVFMLIGEDGSVEGSVTGGCIEADLTRRGGEMIAARAAPEVLSYGISDELAQEAGLMCGGTVQILLRTPQYPDVAHLADAVAAAAAGRPTAIATLLDGPAAGATMTLVDGVTAGTLQTAPLLDHNVERELRAAMHTAGSVIRRFGADGATLGDELRVHLHSYLTRARMLIVGAIDFSAALASFAESVGYEVSIIDARPAFAASDRFSPATHTVIGWPQDVIPGYELDQRDVVLVLSHDSRFDEPALIAAIDSDCGYIGALGSRRTTADRTQRLRERGLSDAQLARINGPCGLDIGAVTPEEVAVSILAEVIGARSHRAGGPLKDTTGRIRGR